MVLDAHCDSRLIIDGYRSLIPALLSCSALNLTIEIDELNVRVPKLMSFDSFGILLFGTL